jgi:hypothetical protein
MNLNDLQLFWKEKYSKEYIAKNSNYHLKKSRRSVLSAGFDDITYWLFEKK